MAFKSLGDGRFEKVVENKVIIDRGVLVREKEMLEKRMAELQARLKDLESDLKGMEEVDKKVEIKK